MKYGYFQGQNNRISFLYSPLKNIFFFKHNCYYDTILYHLFQYFLKKYAKLFLNFSVFEKSEKTFVIFFICPKKITKRNALLSLLTQKKEAKKQVSLKLLLLTFLFRNKKVTKKCAHSNAVDGLRHIKCRILSVIQFLN